MQEQYMQWHEYLMDADRIPHAIVAILITMIAGVITGPLAGNANPFLWWVMDKLVGGLGDRLDRPARSMADLMFRGFFITALGLAIALAVGVGFRMLATFYPLYSVTEAMLLALLLTSGSVWFALLRLYFALEKKEVGKGAYYAIARSERKNLSVGDDLSITRCAMGYAARAYDKGMIAPVLWYLIGGLPVAVVYSVLAALTWRFGKDGFGKGFAAIPYALEKLMGFIPSLFSAAMLLLASLFAPTAKLRKGLASLAGMKNRASYEQGGLPLSVLAWSLNVSLGGAFQGLGGSAIKGAWVGPEKATARNDHKHLRRALIINLMAQLLFIVVLACAYLWGVQR